MFYNSRVVWLMYNSLQNMTFVFIKTTEKKQSDYSSRVLWMMEYNNLHTIFVPYQKKLDKLSYYDNRVQCKAWLVLPANAIQIWTSQICNK